MVRRCLENKAAKYLSDHCTPVTAVSSRHLRSANQHHRLHSAVGLSLLRSGTHCRPNFVVCPTVLMTLGAR